MNHSHRIGFDRHRLEAEFNVKLEIVSHCWNYSRLLTYQLSSLALHPPQNVTVSMTVFLTEEDERTCSVVEHFRSIAMPAGVTVRPWYLPKEKLMRREIGRNLAALATDADWVWFTDCDHLFGDGALDQLKREVVCVDGPLVFPRYVLKNRTHELGDNAIERANGAPRVLRINTTDFARSRNHKAIGGIQIARGDVVREKGYLKDSRIQSWTAERWKRCRGDMWFRRNLGGSGIPIEIPNVYRIRHSHQGRTHQGVRL